MGSWSRSCPRRYVGNCRRPSELPKHSRGRESAILAPELPTSTVTRLLPAYQSWLTAGAAFPGQAHPLQHIRRLTGVLILSQRPSNPSDGNLSRDQSLPSWYLSRSFAHSGETLPAMECRCAPRTIIDRHLQSIRSSLGCRGLRINSIIKNFLHASVSPGWFWLSPDVLYDHPFHAWRIRPQAAPCNQKYHPLVSCSVALYSRL